MKLRFDRRYAALTAIIFAVEVLIAIFVKDTFIRPFVGDALVVVLIYCFVLSFFDLPRFPAALGVLLFAFCVETLQYFDFVNLIGLGQNRLARIVIGTTFSPFDFLAYASGFAVILCSSRNSRSRNAATSPSAPR